MTGLRTSSLFFLGSLLAAASAPGQQRERAEVPERWTWDLTHLYPDDEAWKKAKQALEARLPEVEKFRGSLGSSPERLRAALDLASDVSREFRRVYAYASLASDRDTRDSKYLAMAQEMRKLAADFDARTAYMEPEILALDRARVEEFVAGEPGLKVHAQYLDDVLRRKAHTGTASEEKIIADAGLMFDGPESVYDVLSDADFPYPEVTLSDGKKVRLDPPAFQLHRASPVREDRRRVFAAFLGKLGEFRRTFGAALYGEVKTHLFVQRARSYRTTLEAALDGDNIPVEVYHKLIENVNANLGTFHRYLRLRRRILGLDALHYHDLYAPLVPGADRTYTVEQAREHVVASSRPLGEEYARVVDRAFDERWMDVYPTTGKRSGAYSSGMAYGVHPFVLLNYNGKLTDVGTVAHELGHALHSWLSARAQPYPLASYPSFLAEVASTFNEALLNDHLLRTMTDDKERLALLGDYLEGIKGSVFRQTQFAEFELRFHEMAERGEALTGDALDKLYQEIVRKYYGHDQGVCTVDDEVKSEWIFIHHFYLNYYVYKYATSFTASAALSEKVLAGDEAAKKRYLELVSAGGTGYAIDLLRRAGVDMTTAEPFALTMRKMNRVMDEIERILDRRGK